MIPILLSKVAQICNGQLINADKLVENDIYISNVSTDSRQIGNDCLFVALVGERFDAHDFISLTEEQDAQALLVSRQIDVSTPQIIVKDTKKALGLLGQYVHQQCKIFTIALTGSCGKTTVKEMLASILNYSGQVLATAGNFNNDIGVPLTLLRSTPSDDFAIIELGANHQNEISYTVNLTHPQVALVNNIAEAHLEGFGSIEGVAKAKGEIFEGLKEKDIAIYNLESNGFPKWETILKNKQIISFSMDNPQADFYASQIQMNDQGKPNFELNTPFGSIHVSLNIVGVHNVANAVAATTLATQAGSSLAYIKEGLEQLSDVKGRVSVETLSSGLKVIDDTYNASVPAMKAAIELLANFVGKRWLILGNMAELGKETLALHREVGEYAAQFQFEQVMTYGDDAKVISEVCHGHHFDSHADLNQYIQQKLKSVKDKNEVVVLIKGANSSRMSDVVSALKGAQL